MGRPAALIVTDLQTYRGKYISPGQLARYVACARSHVYNQMTKGALPYRRIGGVIRILTVDARVWAQESTVPIPPIPRRFLSSVSK